jgi:hypothetical protein
MAQKDRRKNKERAIENLKEQLNPHQLRALNYIESTGWQLFCVRNSLFQNPMVVVVNSEGDVFATMEHDGELNLTPHLALRKDDLRA